jgi:hypothetical protein
VADKVTGMLFGDPDERSEPLVDRSGSLTVLGNVNCAVKWKFQANTPTPRIALSGDYTYWSMC